MDHDHIPNRPNVLVLCIDQWDMHMDLPEGVGLPALERLQRMGVTFNRQYCTVPICTPSRATMWTGQHAKKVGMWDNTNFAWISSGELPRDVPTLGTMLREQGYYTAFKGKWHLSENLAGEDMLDDYGFSDFQRWGDMFGAPLHGETHDDNVAMHTVDWLEHKAPALDQPWLLVSSMVNPHDIMYYYSDADAEFPEDGPVMKAKLHTDQDLGPFRDRWNPDLPENFADDLSQQPEGVRSYKEAVRMTYGAPPDDREDLWANRRNYLINCMRLVDWQIGKILDAMDRQGRWENTVVIFTSDHGEMNGAHRIHQKGAIHFDEAAVVNFTAVVPGGPQGERTSSVGSHLDLVPTILDFAGVDEGEMRERYPQLTGRSMRPSIMRPAEPGPRGSAEQSGDGALVMWDGLNMLDPQWNVSGGLGAITNLTLDAAGKHQVLKDVGQRYGAPDFGRRTFFRAVVDGQYKLVRWFSPREYGRPMTVDELYAQSDVTLHDLVNDPGEMENIGSLAHPQHDPQLAERMLAKLNALIEQELGDDDCPFNLDMFGTQDVTYGAG